MKKMNMDGLITRIADKGYTKKDSAVILGDILDAICDAVAEGYEVCLSGFGSFSSIETKPRRARNVQTGEEMIIPAHRKLKFKPGAALRRAAEGAAE